MYNDELSMCRRYIKNKFPKKKFTKFNWESYTADKNKKTYTKKLLNPSRGTSLFTLVLGFSTSTTCKPAVIVRQMNFLKTTI